jgi:hypothetical protein
MSRDFEVELAFEGEVTGDKPPWDIEKYSGLSGANGWLSEHNELRFLPVLFPEIKAEFTTTAEEIFNGELNGDRIAFDVTASTLQKRLPRALTKLNKSAQMHKERVQSLKDFVALAVKWEKEGKKLILKIHP